MRLLALLTPLFLLPATLLAEKPAKDPLTDLKHPAKACLWKVEGKGLTKPSWLFGTIHIGDPRVTTLHPRAQKAFESLDVFYAEIDLDPAAQAALTPLMMRKDGKTLSGAIGPELSKELDAMLKSINPEANAEPFQPLKTWVVTITLTMLDLMKNTPAELQGKEALDAVLQARATEAGKKTDALETADSQVKIFDVLNEKEQQAFLAATIKQMKEDPGAGEKQFKELLAAYLTGTAKDLGEVMKKAMVKVEENKELTERFMKSLLDDRNIGMANKADEFMQGAKDKSHFFAVGALHYTGKASVQKLLRKKGYTVKPAFK
ncbi:MAG: TraB/GumN family protein [Roseibacillus sp.]|nr:TraB/GumN family protein [Roseibacillus sp.]